MTVPKASITHDGPALCCTWSKDGSKVISGGVDKTVKVFDVASGNTVTLQGVGREFFDGLFCLAWSPYKELSLV